MRNVLGFCSLELAFAITHQFVLYNAHHKYVVTVLVIHTNILT